SVTACGFIGNLLRGENAGSRRAHRDDAGTDGMTAPHVASRARPAWVLLPGSAAWTQRERTAVSPPHAGLLTLAGAPLSRAPGQPGRDDEAQLRLGHAHMMTAACP